MRADGLYNRDCRCAGSAQHTTHAHAHSTAGAAGRAVSDETSRLRVRVMAYEAIAAAGRARLDEYDQSEWWDVARRLRPDITRKQFEQDWTEFLHMKSRARAQ